MAINNPYQQYKQNSINTATPAELTLMLYNGAIKFSLMAKMAMEEKNIEKTNEAILRAQAIVQELNMTLNMDYEISKEFRALYTFVLEKLLDANIQKKTSIIDDEVMPILEGMRDNWKLAIEEAKKPAGVQNVGSANAGV
ncbi:flagellar protein FliS [Andreesenia angusta]|uniref:Flagellar secretion chaperone FliS n=1 Tax=Andreesenia angusta TaxID=39480 RepID=A0A1S1V5A4_9FIRM|nr:flagellar export chaperone FliS [Andreesenia angusta]OHW61580.1 flagellar protein FliS [Andreesenia angusta]